MKAPRKYVHDPILYAYMRACGAPRDYWWTYRRQLGLVGPPRYRPYAPPPEEFSSFVRLLSLQYAEHDLDVGKCLRAVDLCARAVEHAIDHGASPRARSGATRALQHAQARYCAARSAEDWRNLKHPGKVTDNRPRPITIDAAEARYLRQRASQRRHLARAARRVARINANEFTLAQEAARKAQHTYGLARANWYLAKQAHASAINATVLQTGHRRRAPRHIEIEVTRTHAEYMSAKASRRKAKYLLKEAWNRRSAP